jgi:hypothetical protein
MLAEVVRARKPLGILELPLGPLGGIDQLRRSLARRLFHPKSGRLRRLIAAGAGAAHVLEATRDFRAFHEMLIESGLAVRAGAPLLPPQGAVPDDLPAVVARIGALMAAHNADR